MDLEKKIKNVKVYVEDDDNKDKMTDNRQISIRKAHLSLRLEFVGVFFVWEFSSQSRIFHSLPMKGYKFLPILGIHITHEGSLLSTLTVTQANPSNGHLRGPVTIILITEHLTVKLLLAVLKTEVCPDRGSSPDLLHTRRML